MTRALNNLVTEIHLRTVNIPAWKEEEIHKEISKYLENEWGMKEVDRKVCSTLFRLSRLHTAETYSKFLSATCRFHRVLEIGTVLRGMVSAPGTDSHLSFQILSSFVSHDVLLFKRDGAWDECALRFDFEARELVAFAFLNFATFASTICGWLRAYDAPSIDEVKTVLQTFLSPQWGTSNMKTQDDDVFSIAGMSQGWCIASECMKVFCLGTSQRKGHEITQQSVQESLGSCCGTLISETIIWMLIQTNDLEYLRRADMAVELGSILPFVWQKVYVSINLKQDGTEVDGSFRASYIDIAKILGAVENGISIAETENKPDGGMKLDRHYENKGHRYMVLWKRLRNRHPIHSEVQPESLASERRGEKLKSLGNKLKSRLDASYSQNGKLVPMSGQASNPSALTTLPGWLSRAQESYIQPASSNEIQPSILGKRQRLSELPQWLSKMPQQTQKESLFLVLEKQGHDLRKMRKFMTGLLQEDGPPLLDEPESENDEAEDLGRYTVEEKKANALRRKRKSWPGTDRTFEVDMEIFLGALTFSNVDPTDKEREHDEVHSSLIRSSDFWLMAHMTANEDLMQSDTTFANSAEEYSDHCKCLLLQEIHYTVQGDIEEKFPELEKSGESFTSGLYGIANTMIQLKIKKAEESRLLFHMKGTAAGRFSLSVLQKMAGMTLCIGFFRDRTSVFERKKDSNIMLFVCRSIAIDDEDLNKYIKHRMLEFIAVRVCGNKSLISKWGPSEGDMLCLEPVTSLAAFHRMLRAVHFIEQIPQRMRHILYGKDIPQLPSTELITSRSGRERVHEKSPFTELRLGVNFKCLEYILCLEDSVCNRSQKKALLMALREMGTLENTSSSISQVLGPPGTGKTTSMCLLIGALLHHSTAGHVGEDVEGRNLLNRKDSVLRYSSRSGGLRIMVCSSSNHTVDHISRKLKAGIPGPRGSKVFPDICRIGRHRYDYQDLADVSVREKSLPFQEYFKPTTETLRPEKSSSEGPSKRKNPSGKAMRAMAEECIVFLSTLSSAMSSSFRRLQVPIDVVIIDEGSHASEFEAMIPVVSASCQRNKQFTRLHTVIFGDHHQLPPVYKMEHTVSSFLARARDFPFSKSFKMQLRSLFERLYDRYRCPVAWLGEQNRTHPGIARIQMRSIYGDKVKHPESIDRFIAPYHKKEAEPQFDGFAPFTFIDTSPSLDRFEFSEGAGKFCNEFEALQVQKVLEKLRSNTATALKGSTTGSGTVKGVLAGQIFITAPYRTQVDFISDYLTRGERFLSWPRAKEAWNITIESVDALQGLESDVVIVSLTRSNRARDIGFLKDARRMNVATSRSRKLLIIIGDSTTVCARSEVLSKYWNACLVREGGHSEVNFVKAARGRKDKRREAEIQDMTKNIRRHRDGYDLRSK